MRTTIDVPEEILRRAKARAALRGIKLKDYVAEVLGDALRGDLGEHAAASPVEERPSQAGRLRLGADCVFPLVRGECGPALREMTPERAHQILEEEEVERSLDPGGH